MIRGEEQIKLQQETNRGLLAVRRFFSLKSSSCGGWTLLELLITITVLSILTLGIIPLVKTSVKRSREQQLREALRDMRDAIKEFRRDTIGMQCAGGQLMMPGAVGGIGGGIGGGGIGGGPPGGIGGGSPTAPPPGSRRPPAGQRQEGPGQGGQPAGGVGQPGVPGLPGMPGGGMQVFIDPRSKVMISDCSIFGPENTDHYPPKLETLVEGVNVVPRLGAMGAAGMGGNPLQGNATENPLVSLKKKVYLRAIPIDPMTGKAEWDLRSSFDEAKATDWGGENVFDVRSKSTATALNGEKYSDW